MPATSQGCDGGRSVEPSIDPRGYRNMMGTVCAPVTIVTTVDANETSYGATVSSFTSLSLEPPLVSVAIDRALAAAEPNPAAVTARPNATSNAAATHFLQSE